MASPIAWRSRSARSTHCETQRSTPSLLEWKPVGCCQPIQRPQSDTLSQIARLPCRSHYATLQLRFYHAIMGGNVSLAFAVYANGMAIMVPCEQNKTTTCPHGRRTQTSAFRD